MSETIKIKLVKVLKGAGIAGVGAALAYMFQHATGIFAGDYSELLAAAGAIVANIFRVMLQKIES